MNTYCFMFAAVSYSFTFCYCYLNSNALEGTTITETSCKWITTICKMTKMDICMLLTNLSSEVSLFFCSVGGNLLGFVGGCLSPDYQRMLGIGYGGSFHLWKRKKASTGSLFWYLLFFAFYSLNHTLRCRIFLQ